MPVKTDKRPIDSYFDTYSALHTNPLNKVIHWVCVPLIVFSIFGLVWSIPFPHLGFLGRYNGFVNWASFLLAFSVYYYYRLSPVLSYAMLLILFAFSLLVVQLEKLHLHHSWPVLWEVCLGILIISRAGQFVGYKVEGKKPSFIDDMKFLLIGPIWLLHFWFKKAGIRY